MSVKGGKVGMGRPRLRKTETGTAEVRKANHPRLGRAKESIRNALRRSRTKKKAPAATKDIAARRATRYDFSVLSALHKDRSR